MGATVDKAALSMLLAGHEVHHVDVHVAPYSHGFSATAVCACGIHTPLDHRADHVTDVLIGALDVWLLPE